MSDETYRGRALAEAAVIRNAAYAEGLLAYASGRGSAPEQLPPTLDGLAAAIAGPGGKEQTEIWAETFAQSLALTLAFRNSLVHAPTKVSDEDVRKVAAAGDRIFVGLVKRLRGTIVAA